MVDEQHPNETPIPDDDAEMSVDILSEDDFEPIADEGVGEDEEIIIKDFLNEDDGEEYSLDYLNPANDVDIISEDDLEPIVDELAEDAEEIVVEDPLNEDNNEPEKTPEYLKPSTPEWKLAARKMREEKEAKKRALLESRRAEDARVIAERAAIEQERKLIKEQQEEEFSQKWAERQQEKQSAVDDMMQRIRAEREQKQAEREEFEEKEFGRKFNYPKPIEPKPYPKPSEIKRMEREQPIDDTPIVSDTQKTAPKNDPKTTDLDSRVSRLSKPDSIEVDVEIDKDEK